jgi:hypothetical protein
VSFPPWRGEPQRFAHRIRHRGITVIEATIQFGHVEVRYRCGGRGTPVLLLAHEAAPRGATSLLELLAERVRLIAPELPKPLSTHTEAPAAELAVWLRGVIDALGLARPAILADAFFQGALLEFAVTDPTRLGRLAVVHVAEHDAERDLVAHTSWPSSPAIQRPRLAVWLRETEPASSREVIAQLAAFLAEAEHPSSSGREPPCGSSGI